MHGLKTEMTDALEQINRLNMQIAEYENNISSIEGELEEATKNVEEKDAAKKVTKKTTTADTKKETTKKSTTKKVADKKEEK